MSLKKHDRAYDLVVFGASGYTGVCLAEHIANTFPTDLKWALAGRSPDKLAKVAADVKALSPDRVQPTIEVSSNTDEDLDKLSKKTFVLITTVGPFLQFGEPSFKACAQNGTHYFDITGEIPFVYRMISKYEATAKKTGALMFPQCGVDSAPTDLVSWLLAKTLRTQLRAKTGQVTASMRMEAQASGGTIHTVIGLFENAKLSEISKTMAPFALSPVPNPTGKRGTPSLFTRLAGVVSIPKIGLATTSLFGTTDGAYVERSWGLLSSLPSRKDEAYGPRFSFVEYAYVRSYLKGVLLHLVLGLGALFLAILPPVRWLAKRVVYQPGTGPAPEKTKQDTIECQAVAKPDFGDSPTGDQPKKLGFCRAKFTGGMYPLTAILVTEAALTVLQDDLQLDGGVYTSACLGQRLIDRVDKFGFKFEAKLIDE